MRSMVTLCGVVLLVGCATVERVGPRLRVERVERSCAVTELAGAMRAHGADALQVDLSGRATCSEGEADVLVTERYSTSWVPAGSLGTAVGAVVATPFVIAGVVLLHSSSGSTSVGRGAGELLGLAALPGVAAGYIVAQAIGPSEVRIADGPPQRVERLSKTEEVAEVPSGRLVTDGAGAGWAVENGSALLPRSELMGVDLHRLLLGGVVVQLDAEGDRLAETLAACRAALKGWAPSGNPGCAEVRQRVADAQRCESGAWPLPQEFEQWRALRLASCR